MGRGGRTDRIPSGIKMCLPFSPSTSTTSGKSASKLLAVKRRFTKELSRRWRGNPKGASDEQHTHSTRTTRAHHAHITRTSRAHPTYITRTSRARHTHITSRSHAQHTYITRTSHAQHTYITRTSHAHHAHIPHSTRILRARHAQITRTSRAHHKYSTRTCALGLHFTQPTQIRTAWQPVSWGHSSKVGQRIWQKFFPETFEIGTATQRLLSKSVNFPRMYDNIHSLSVGITRQPMTTSRHRARSIFTWSKSLSMRPPYMACDRSARNAAHGTLLGGRLERPCADDTRFLSHFDNSKRSTQLHIWTAGPQTIHRAVNPMRSTSYAHHTNNPHIIVLPDFLSCILNGVFV